MAEANISVAQDQFKCPICLDLLEDPVTIPCGHSYCMSCISRQWDQDDQRRVYSCPQCRQTFTPRPALGKNVMLDELLEKLKRTQIQTADLSHCYAEFGDVECDVCTSVRKYKAVKSCLVCLNSFCQSHLQQHENLFEGERHYFIDAVEQLQQMICSKHDRLLEVYCRTDQESICMLCMKEDHKNHDVSPAAKIMKQSASSLPVPPGSPELFNLNVSSRLPSDLSINPFSKPACLLQGAHPRTLGCRLETPWIDGQPITGSLSGSVRKSFHKKLKKKMDHFLNLEMVSVSGQIICYKNNITDGPKNRNEILQYLHMLSMDSNTINKILQLSEGNQVAANTGRVQQYPDHPDRFECWPQVLCRESVCGRCYWEVEWSGRAGVDISVSYKSISRKEWGDECKFGCNDRSWSLYCSPSRFIFWAGNKEIKLDVNYKSSRIGVYVDYNAGVVQFFKISDKMKLIYIFQNKFTEPLYPGFRVYVGSTVKLCYPAMYCR